LNGLVLDVPSIDPPLGRMPTRVFKSNGMNSLSTNPLQPSLMPTVSYS